MNKWLERWHAMAPREQWLTYGVGLVVLAMLYVVLVNDAFALRLTRQQTAEKAAQARMLEAQAGIADLNARMAADPNVPFRSALQTSQASRDQLIGNIDSRTATLVPPARMRALLEELLRDQPKLKVVALESFSEPLKVPGGDSAPAKGDKAEPVAPAAVMLYRHGVRLKLEGGYFDLLRYLQAIQDSGWTLNWDSLDYSVGEGGPGRAQISLQLYTLSRQAGWIGV